MGGRPLYYLEENRTVSARELIERVARGEKPKKVLGLTEQSIQHTPFWKFLDGNHSFQWTSGRDQGQTFRPHGYPPESGEGYDTYVRGSYTGTREFGDIKDDLHQVGALMDDIDRGDVSVQGPGGDATADAKRAVEQTFSLWDDEDDDY
jgi:hypothetical protein